MIDQSIYKRLHSGVVIPAHPLALNKKRHLDEKRQRALTRYYLDAGAGGIAVGVHTTQFTIRDPKINLFKKVLRIAAEEIDQSPKKNIIKIAGVCGETRQAIEEAKYAKELGYDLALLSNSGLQKLSERRLLERAQVVSKIIPLFAFYLQPAVGGKILSVDFWERFCMIDNVYAIKIAPFNRYQTLDVVRATARSPRNKEIALYTGNDDNILLDLLTEYRVQSNNGIVTKEIVGGLLGHWAVWTKKAVELLRQAKKIKSGKIILSNDILTLAQQITDSNAAFFDAANNFKGCIAGIHEVLRRQGLMENTLCLDPNEKMSSGQSEEITRVYEEYPHLHDDRYVEKNLRRWLK